MDVRLPDGTIIKNVPDGTTKADLVAKLQGNGMAVPSEWLQAAPPSQPVQEAGQSLNRGLSDIPRQIGLTARYALEGPAQAAQIFTEPVAGLMRLGGIKTKPLGEVASGFADAIGLPKPESGQERVVGDATRLLAGTGGMLGASRAMAQLPGMAGTVGAGMAANPTAQLTSATGAGTLGGISREGGGNELQQAGAALIGGVAGGMMPGAANAAVNAGKRAFNRLTPQQMDVQINSVLQRAGMDYSQVPERARQSLRTQMQDALRAGQELDPAAVRRLAEFQTIGATPTRGMVTQDPVRITQEMNLAKMGANSADGQLQGLARVQNQNNTRLIDVMNEAGAGRGDPLAAGERVAATVLGRQADLRWAEKAAWDAARSSPGYKQPISSKVISDINQTLGDEGLMPFMNPTISRYMEAFQTGQPFTPQDYRNLQSMLSREVFKGGNEGAAAKAAARVLASADVLPITNPRGIDFGNSVITGDMAQRLRAMDAAPEAAISAVNHARGATRAAYAYEDSNALVRSVLSESGASDPTRVAQKFIVGGTPREAQMLAQEVGPQGIPVIRDALLAHLKDKALSGASDEIGKFSQSAFNKALNQIGDRKLALFFSPEELTQLRTVGRVASYMQNQPVGSAVNNSNSGALLLGKGIDLLNKIPGGQTFIGQPLQNISISMQQRAAQNVAPGLLATQPRQPMASGLLAPAAAFSGGLLAPPVTN
jgi:hypothetical protein